MRSIVQHNAPVIKRLRSITEISVGQTASHPGERAEHGKGSNQFGTCSRGRSRIVVAAAVTCSGRHRLHVVPERPPSAPARSCAPAGCEPPRPGGARRPRRLVRRRPGVRLTGLGPARPSLPRSGGPAPSHLDPARDRVQVGAGRNAVAGGGLGLQVLDGSPVIADEQACHLGEQVAAVTGYLPQFCHRGGCLCLRRLPPGGVPPGRAGQAGHGLLIDLGPGTIAHGDCPAPRRRPDPDPDPDADPARSSYCRTLDNENIKLVSNIKMIIASGQRGRWRRRPAHVRAGPGRPGRLPARTRLTPGNRRPPRGDGSAASNRRS
jgi:hypothetical protein